MAKKQIKTKYYRKNKSKLLAYQNEYNEKNRGWVNSENRNRELNKEYGTPIQTDEHKKQMLAGLYDEAIRLTRETGELHVVDHVYPACKGGLHEPENCRIITASDNSKKYHNFDKYLPDLRDTDIKVYISEVNIIVKEEDADE